MAVSLPDFNVLFSIWLFPNTPGDGDPPDYTDVDGQLYFDSRQAGGPIDYTALDKFSPYVIIRMSLERITEWMDTYIIVWQDPLDNDTYYRAFFKQRVHAGFPNEYLEIFVFQCDDFGGASRQFVVP